MTRRSIFIVIIGLSLVVIIGLVLFFKRGGNTAAVQDVDEGRAKNSAALFPLSDIPTSETINIGTKSGVVSVKNFYKNALGQEGDTVLVKSNKEYEITYNRFDSSFWIIIKARPITDSLRIAENDFLSMLGNLQEGACRLDVSWGVAYGINDSQYPLGKSFPLSFCQNALQ